MLVFRFNRQHRRAALALALTGLAAVAVQAQTAEADRAYCERQEGIAKTVCLRDLGSGATASKPAAPPAPAAPATPATPAAPDGNTTSNTAATTAATATPANGAAPYKVVDGYHVDATTLKGFQTWRAAACDRCHGANQEGLVGPSLVNSLKVLTKAQFVETVTKGRLPKGMPSFESSPSVVANLDALYAYLKGRSDGAITRAKVEAMP